MMKKMVWVLMLAAMLLCGAYAEEAAQTAALPETADADALTEGAVALYDEEKYEEAMELFLQAAEQGRDVFVVPGNIDMPSCAGSNGLLRDGAIAVSSGWDVLSEYAAQYPEKIHRQMTYDKQRAYPDEVVRAAQTETGGSLKVAQKPKKPAAKSGKMKKEIDKQTPEQYSDAERKRPALSEDEAKIVTLLEQGMELVDDIIAETGKSAGAILASLTMLEVKGVITRLPGKRVKMK